jgi:hypothetical protein
MSDCTFCGQPAGIFKSQHEACKDRHEYAPGEIRDLAERAAMNAGELDTFRDRVDEIARGGFLGDGEVATAISEGFTRAVNQALEDSVLSEAEDNALGEFMEHCGLSQGQLDLSTITRLGMAAALRDVMEGKIPERLKVSGNIPFNFEGDEQLVWLWSPVQLAEERTQRTRLGLGTGPSVRIARGVYWHVGGFASRQIESTSVEYVDRGVLAATTQHLYFAGEHRSMKIPYEKIISWEQYDNGIGICQSGARAKPQTFETGEGWFIYNLVRNLAQMAAEPEDTPRPPRSTGKDRAQVLGFAAR